MKRAVIERNLVVVLFILSLVMYSFAQRDTRRATHHLFTQAVKEVQNLVASNDPAQ
jgi:hypothetical protein